MASPQNVVTQIGNSVTTFLDNERFIDTAIAQIFIKPDNFRGIAGFVFDIIESDILRLQSSITDHFTENNTALQNQIANKPEQFTVRGVVAETVTEDIGPLSILSPSINKLLNIASYLPALTTQTLQVLDSIKTSKEILKTVKQTEDLFTVFKNLLITPNDTRQAKAFSYFYALWQSRRVFTVETPWHIFTNMAILDLKATQDTNSNEISSFEITFKELRFAEILIEATSEKRLAENEAEVKNKANTKGKKEPLSSFLKKGLKLIQRVF